MREFRDAIRSLAADRRFTAAAVALLSLTIGASTAIYAIVDAVILRPLPFAEPDRVALIWQRDLRRAMPVMEVSYGEAVDWRRRSRSFDQVAVIGSVNWPLPLAGTSPESLSMAPVSASFFEVVGRQPAIGRRFVSADEQGSKPLVALISYGLWTRRFGRDPGVIGRALRVASTTGKAGEPLTIVGVMPEDFDFPRGTEIWSPAAPLVRMNAADWTGGDVDAAMKWLRVFYGIGRLRPGVTPGMATSELSVVVQATDTHGGPEPPTDAVVTGVRSYLLGPAEPVLWTLLGGAALMLLVACANVAGLQVSRAARRARALGIRLALGARHAHLVRQSVAESVLITMSALAGAVAICLASVKGLLLLAPADVPRLESVNLLDVRVLAFAAAVAFLTVLVCGLWPAVVVGRLDALSVLAHGPATTGLPRGRLIQRLVVTAQVALALTLLVGSALFVRTVRGLDRTVLGFEPDALLAVNVTPDGGDDLDHWNRTYAAIEARVAALPGVTSVGAVYLRPLSGPIGLDNQPMFPGQVPEDPRTWGLNPHHNLQTVTPGYFEAMGIPVVRGRGFLPTDTLQSPGVVVVSQHTARRFWPGLDPIGQRLFDMSYRRPEGAPATVWQTVVGVVEDVRYRGLNDVRLDTYVPAAQSNQRVQYLMVRASGDAADVAASVRAAAIAVDPGASVTSAAAMADIVASESAPWRFVVRVFLGFASLAALLSAMGLGTVIALAVSTRRRELAIRAALGADRRRLRAVVMKEGTWLVGLGVLLGLACALALGRAVAAVLVGVQPHDPIALLSAAALALSVGLLACWWPARRAASADPVEALRAE